MKLDYIKKPLTFVRGFFVARERFELSTSGL
jgi:hypothetical protein